MKDLKIENTLPSQSKEYDFLFAPERIVELPQRYTGVADWPVSMIVPCWMCDIKHDDYPRFVPLKPERVQMISETAVDHSYKWRVDRDKPTPLPIYCEKSQICAAYKNECIPHGHFCSWPCAARYIRKEMPDNPDLPDTLTIFEAEFSGVKKITIPIAPAKTIMAKYSVTGLSEAEYSSLLDDMMEHNCVPE